MFIVLFWLVVKIMPKCYDSQVKLKATALEPDEQGRQPWRMKSRTDVTSGWDAELRRVQEHPDACECARTLISRCERMMGPKAKCVRKWGITEFFVISNPNLHLIQALPLEKINLQLALVKFVKDGNVVNFIGLFVGNENCTLPNLRENFAAKLCDSAVQADEDDGDDFDEN